MNNLPKRLYTPESVAKLDRLAIEGGIPGFTLMQDAGKAVFSEIQQQFSETQQLLVLCGAGNNAGDGYIVARLAQQHGMTVNVISLINPDELQGDAKQAYLHWIEIGKVSQGVSGSITKFINNTDLVVDALLGTGISRDVSGEWETWIEAVNSTGKPVIAIDVPSGLDARTGKIRGAAIRANTTVSFIGLKTGLFTASGKACCGQVEFDSLDVPENVYRKVEAAAYLLRQPELPSRSHDSHKGQHGHVLVIGGNFGMPGAVILSARAALRSGAGLVSVVTRAEHVSAVTAACPEVTVHGSVNGDMPATLRSNFSCVAIGPGLGQDAWAQRLLSEAIKLEKPIVFDADALNLLASKQVNADTLDASKYVITPHPGEAARLLSLSTDEIQNDRYAAAQQLHEMMGGVVVLKGSGTIIFDGDSLKVCPFGNPAMAVAGMGDVLTGVIASLIGQGMAINSAATEGVCLHAMAGDLAADGNDRGMLASDVIEKLRQVSNL